MITDEIRYEKGQIQSLLELVTFFLQDEDELSVKWVGSRIVLNLRLI